MNHVHLRSVLIASMICIGLVLHPSSPAAEEQAKPQESPSHAALTAEVLQLRREVESLRQRLDLSEKNTADIPNGHGGDAGEKERLVAETQKILIHFNSGKATVWKEAHGKIRELRVQVAAALKELQDGYTRATKLDEAVAIRDAIIPGRCAAPPAPAMMTCNPRAAAPVANSVSSAGVRCAETIRFSCGMWNFSRISTAQRIVSQSDLLPMTTATRGASDFIGCTWTGGAWKVEVESAPRSARATASRRPMPAEASN